MSAPSPKELFLVLLSIILSIPSKAPPHINSILVVFNWINSWWGCFFFHLCGGTDAIVPLIFLKVIAESPSPDTSLVIDGFSDFLAILSISSI